MNSVLKKTLTTFLIFCIPLLYCGKMLAQQPGQKKILWDGTHAETSGTSADWCIDADTHNLNWSPSAVTGGTHSNPQILPTPTQTAVTASTAETYWEGALSYWAIDCVRRGYWVESLPPLTGKITYGSATNTQDLSKYDVFVVCEPNIRFTQAEITAMMQFIQNGGALFAISDHTVSDRNNDGWDSPMIWNDFMTNNPVQNNAFGFTFALQDFSDATSNSNVAASTTDSITHGPFGPVTQVKWSNGTCMTMNPSQNPSVKGHVWKSGKGQADTAAVCVTARYKCGRIAAIGDSSPPDDGTGNPASTLYTGYTGDANGNHRPWLMNMMIWLAEATNCNATDVTSINASTDISVFPNPSDGQFTVSGLQPSGNKIEVCDIFGRTVFSTTSNRKQETVNLSVANGIYFLQVSAPSEQTESGGKHLTKKIVIQH